ncbi:MAG TPA: response regulator [Xanthobacteraceae bacterium]|jgi:CheY-like chemotaxis protein
MRTTSATPVEALTGSIRVLVAADSQYLRKLIRNLLVNVGIKRIDEVGDGLAGFEAIKSLDPDIAIIDWELPLLNGAELVRIIRTPGMLARRAVPVIMFGASAERWRIAEAKRLGVNAYLTMPISAKTLLDRIVSILSKSPAAAAVGEQDPNRLFMV